MWKKAIEKGEKIKKKEMKFFRFLKEEISAFEKAWQNFRIGWRKCVPLEA